MKDTNESSKLRTAAHYVAPAAVATGDTRQPNILGVAMVSDLHPMPTVEVGSLSVGPNAYSNAMGDFTAAVISGTNRVLLTDVSIPLVEDKMIQVTRYTVDVSGQTTVENVTISPLEISGSTGGSSYEVTLAGLGDTFDSGDTVNVFAFGPTKAYNSNLNTKQFENVTPIWGRRFGPVELITAAQTLVSGAAFADVGNEIDARGYNQLGLWLTIDINDGQDIEIRLLHKHTLGGAEEYREIYLGNPAANITTINLNDYQIASDADQLFKINIPVSATSPYIQVQARAGATTGATDADIDAAQYTLAWAA